MRRQMRRFMLALAVLGLMARAPAPARADLTTFDAEGTFSDGATLSGTSTIDTMLGLVTAINLSITPLGGSPELFTTIDHQGLTGLSQYAFNSFGTNGDQLGIVFPLTSLIGYQGGPLSPNSGYLNVHAEPHPMSEALVSGSFTTVPEPNSLVVSTVGAVACVLAYVSANKRRAASTTPIAD